MSTRCLVAKEEKNGTVRVVYVHYDGYPSGVGAELLSNWPRKDLDKLISMGNMSTLGGGSYGEPAEKLSSACDLLRYATEDYSLVEYVYLNKPDGRWYFASTDDGCFRPLTRKETKG